MSYQVFARKYRPQTFDEVVGQEHITQTLKNAIAQNRLAHAYLFVGPRGTGKTSTARIIAKALNCETGPTVTPCGTCDACKEIAAGTSLDVLEIDGASNNGVEQVRELRDNVRFAPTRGQYKIYVIDEVHMLTAAAFNALLKTLEEPPAHVKFIFATTEPQKVLATILSRCQRFDLRRIPATLIAKHLQYIAGCEKITLAPAAAAAVAKGAEGGLRDAESMLDQLVAFCGDSIAEEDVLNVFGFTAQQTVSDLCAAVLQRDTPAALALLHAQSELGKDLVRLLSDLIGHLRNLLVCQADPSALRQEEGDESLPVLETQSRSIDAARLLELMDQFAAAEGRMKWAPNKRLLFEITLIKAVQTLGQANLDDVLRTLTEIRAGESSSVRAVPSLVSRLQLPTRPLVAQSAVAQSAVAQSAVAHAERIPVAVPAAVPVASDAPLQMEELWKMFRKKASALGGLLGASLDHGIPLEIRGDVLVVGFAPDSSIAADSISSASNRARIEEALSSVAGRPFRIQCEVREDIALPTLDASDSEAEEKQTDYRNDPKIKRALQLFSGELAKEM